MPGGRRHGTGQGPGAHAAATGRPVPVSSAAQPLPVAQNQLTLRPTQDAPGFRTLDAPAQVPAELGETWPLTHNHMSYLLTPPAPAPSVSLMASPHLVAHPERPPTVLRQAQGGCACASRTGVPAPRGRQGRRQPCLCAPTDPPGPLGSDESRPQRCPQTGPPAAGTRVAACPGTPAQTSAGRNQGRWVQTVVQDQRAPGPAAAILQGGKLTPRVTRLPAGAHGSPWP